MSSTTATPAPVHPRDAARSALALIAFLAISFGVAALGRLSTIAERQRLVRGRRQGVLDAAERGLRPGLDRALHAHVGRGLAGLARAEAHRACGPRSTVYVVQLVLNAHLDAGLLRPLPGDRARRRSGSRSSIIVAIDVMVLVTMLRFWPVRRLAARAADPVLGVGALRDDAQRGDRGDEHEVTMLTSHRNRECPASRTVLDW